jgi:hypothetical protein
MSTIENWAMPYAVPLIRGESVTLIPYAQRALASLVCLIAMRLEFLGIMRAVPQSERDRLRHHLWPTDHWKIWIAHYGGTRQDDHFAKYYAAQMGSVPADKVGPEFCNAQVATLVIGQLCTHSFYSPVIDFRGYEGITLCQIWPPNQFDLDIELLSSLDDKALLWLHEAFARESAPMPTA